MPCRCREMQPQHRTATQFAVCVHESAMPPDDRQRGRQPEPGAAAGRLGGEEGVEDLVENRLRDARSGVFDLDRDVVAGIRDVADRGIVIRQCHVPGAHLDQAAVRHRILCITHQIQENLHQLGGISAGLPQLLIHLKGHRGVLSKSIGADRLELSEQLREVDRQPSDRCPAGKGEDLSDHVRASFDGEFGGLQDLPPTRVRFTGREQLHGHQDRGEHVVQIMRDSACQGAETLHPLRAERSTLASTLLGDVGVDGENGVRLSALALHQGPAALDHQLDA